MDESQHSNPTVIPLLEPPPLFCISSPALPLTDPVGASVSFTQMDDVDLFAAPEEKVEDDVSAQEHIETGILEVKDFFDGRTLGWNSSG
jgi:hypothetical protein